MLIIVYPYLYTIQKLLSEQNHFTHILKLKMIICAVPLYPKQKYHFDYHLPNHRMSNKTVF